MKNFKPFILGTLIGTICLSMCACSVSIHLSPSKKANSSPSPSPVISADTSISPTESDFSGSDTSSSIKNPSEVFANAQKKMNDSTTDYYWEFKSTSTDYSLLGSEFASYFIDTDSTITASTPRVEMADIKSTTPAKKIIKLYYAADGSCQTISSNLPYINTQFPIVLDSDVVKKEIGSDGNYIYGKMQPNEVENFLGKSDWTGTFIIAYTDKGDTISEYTFKNADGSQKFTVNMNFVIA